MPFFGALWIWDPFISLDELWQNCVRPTTFADVHRNRIQNHAVLGSGDFPCFVFSPHCVCCWLLPPPSSPFPHEGSPVCKCLHHRHHGFIHSAQIILGSGPSSRCSFGFGLLVCCLRLSLASSGWPHLNPNDPEPFAIEQTIFKKQWHHSKCSSNLPLH